MPGVVAVFTKDDLADLIKAPLPMAWDPPGVEIKVPENWPLSGSQVKHVGDAIAVVLAESKGQAMDAADLVIADLDPLPAVVDPEKALEDGSPLVWEEFGTNATHHWAVAGGDFAAAEAEAEVVVKQRVPNHRISGAPIEPRGCVGETRGESVALYSSTQIPHIARFLLAGILEMPEDKIRVVAPDVGGGFGAKLQLYGEEVLVLALAKKLNRPVKYVETRSEHMSNSHHGRDQIATSRSPPRRTARSRAARRRSSPTPAPTTSCSRRSSRRWASRWRAAVTSSRRSTSASPGSSRTRCRSTPSVAPGGRSARTGSS